MHINITIPSIDARSGAEFLREHGEQIATEVGRQIQQNHGVKRAIRGIA